MVTVGRRGRSGTRGSRREQRLLGGGGSSPVLSRSSHGVDHPSSQFGESHRSHIRVHDQEVRPCWELLAGLCCDCPEATATAIADDRGPDLPAYRVPDSDSALRIVGWEEGYPERTGARSAA